MNLLNKVKFTIVFSCVFLLTVPQKSFSQQYNLNNPSSELKIFGTSSLHDWHEDVKEQKGSVQIDTKNNLIINSLEIEIIAESLKSGKRGMDKNTYKALNTNEYKTINFQLTEIKNISLVDEQYYRVKALGKLTVSGFTKKIELDFNLNLKNNEIKLTGEKAIKMTDFNIDPPKALLGTITTGDEVVIKFNTIFTK